jgi:DNA-binding CsgD family transcriptional regulator
MGAWPLVGRDEELDLFDRLLRDGRGAVVVAGPGTGKTRLVQEATERASAHSVTERVTATRSAQALPLAAVAALLPDRAPETEDRLELFRSVRRALTTRADGRSVVLAVDDAHLLDPASAALVHHLVTTDGVRPLIALRAGEPVEDAITALWRDGAAERVDLQPLGPDDVAVLLGRVLDGEVEAATAWRLWKVAGGNPLYVHELVTEATRVGTLAVTGGVWRWRGDVTVGARLRELVEQRLRGLDERERSVIALLAVGELVAPEVVEALCEPAAVTSLQARGFVVREGTVNAAQLRLDHPLFAEVVRGALSTTERAHWARELADAHDPEAGDDLALLRRAMWQVEAGVATDPDLLTRAGEGANRRFDHALGERLAAAALAAGAGSRARLVRAEACWHLGRYETALEHVAPLHDVELPDDLLARLAMVIAEAGYWGLGRAAETHRALARLAARATGSAATQRIRALESAVMFAAGNLAEASALADPIATDAGADGQARLRAVTAAAAGRSRGGRPDEALELCDGLLPVAFANADELPRGLGWVIAQVLLAQYILGRFVDAEQLVVPLRERAIAEGDDEVVSGSSLVLGRLALSRGDLAGAAKLLREAESSLRAYDSAGYLPWCLGMMAQAAGQRGDPVAARDALHELAGDDWLVRVNDAEVELGRAWALAASGEIGRPVRLLVDTAAAARLRGDVCGSGLLLHEALRMGAEPRDVMAGLEAACVTGGLPVHQMFLDHARALADRDGGALDGVAGSFEGVGMRVHAAEAAAEAARAHRDAGLPARATRSAGQATRLLAECPGAATPALAHLAGPQDLTRREREVSHLAADGLSNNEIAAQLGVSVRTVEGHILRATTKLGVRSRGELERALGPRENA